MDFRDFRKAGHWPTLLAAFLYFDFSFMVWVTLGPLIIYIARDLNIGVEEKLTLVAIPILAGAVLRMPVGMLADHFGGKRTAIVAQLLVIFAMAFAWQFGLNSVADVQLLGVMLGVAGAAFAVALPQASRWYPPHYQGIVMGIAGAGNSGVVLNTLIVPSLAENYGWQNVFGLLLIPLGFAFMVYLFMAKDAPDARRPVNFQSYRTLLADQDSWWFMLFYFITFGGFVGLASALPVYFTAQYHVSGVAAGLMVAIIVMCGSGVRPIGGMIADRIGGIRSLTVLFSLVALAYFIIAMMPGGPAPEGAGVAWDISDMPAIAWVSVLLFSLGMLALGMGNGSVFQLIPQRFHQEIGTMTGLVGFAGGTGGYFLAKTLGVAKGLTGDFSSGFVVFGVLALIGLFALSRVKRRWRTTWGAVSGARI